MMELHSRIKKSELNDPERFEFLIGLKDKVLQMDELHPSDDNDSHYLFLVWVKPDDTGEVIHKMKENIRKADLDRDWSTHILPKTGEGLIIVSTWCC